MEMEKGSNSWNPIINELTQGRELAKQLQNHLHPSTPHETREFLIEKILSTYNKALQMANLPGFSSQSDPSQISFHGGSSSESPRSVSNCSARSAESSDLETDRGASKKRKTMPRWIETVTVSNGAGGGLEGPLSDGYNWRKYGQKDILGAAFPRNYYRCTHRRTQGCFATKQVQKTDEDPTIFQVIYKGHHTCSKSIHVTQPSTSQNLPPAPHEPTHPTKPEPDQSGPLQGKQNHSQQIASNLVTVAVQPQLKVETKDLDAEDPEGFFFQSFPFPFSSAFLEATGSELADAWLISASPATSGSEHLQSSPGHIIAGGNGVWTPESDINDHSASGPDSPMGRLEFTLDELGIDPNFPFDNPELFS